MKLYLLSRIEDDVDYDEFEAKLIRAKSEKRAREVANIYTGDEGKIWEIKKKVKAEIIHPNGDEMIIIEDFNAG